VKRYLFQGHTHRTLAYPIGTVLLTIALSAVFGLNARADSIFFTAGNLR